MPAVDRWPGFPPGSIEEILEDRNGKSSTPITSQLPTKKWHERCPTQELQVRRILHRLGARFRVYPRDLPGRPDIANRSRDWCVFVHGCFWHGQPIVEGVHLALARIEKLNKSRLLSRDVRELCIEIGDCAAQSWERSSHTAASRSFEFPTQVANITSFSR